MSDLDRIRACGLRPTSAGDIVVNQRKDGSAYYSGIQTCGSIWGCSVCSAKIRQRRADDLAAGMDRFAAAGGHFVFVTLTVPHAKNDRLDVLLDAAMKAWQKGVVAGAGWQNDQAEHGIVGWVRSVEITYGEHGWHPHIHALLMVSGGRLFPTDVSGLLDTMTARWNREVHKRLGRKVSARAQHAQVLEDASTYLVKVQESDGFLDSVDDQAEHSLLSRLHLEMLRGDLKTGKKSATPFDLLHLVAEYGQKEHHDAWNEYLRATKGRRCITWSKSARDLFAETMDVTDDDLAEEEAGGEPVAFIPQETWKTLTRHGMELDVLEVVEQHGSKKAIAQFHLSACPTGLRLPVP